MVFTGGLEDYSNIAYGDYGGDAVAKNGFRAFDESLIFTRIAILEHTPTQIVKQQEMLIAYAEEVQRMNFFPCPLGLTGYEAVDFRNREGTYTGSPKPNSWLSRLIYGDVNIKHPTTGATVLVSAIAHWLGNAAKKDKNTKKIWLSEAGQKRGRIAGTLGINYNLGTAARREEANAVDSAGISMAIKHDKYGMVCWGNGTLSVGTSLLRHANIAELILEATRITNRINEGELFDPNSVQTWKRIYRSVVKEMQDIQDGEGLYKYIYEGDQNADTVEEATVNTQDSIANGEYDYNLYLFPTPALKYIRCRMNVTALGTRVTVEEV